MENLIIIFGFTIIFGLIIERVIDVLINGRLF